MRFKMKKVVADFKLIRPIQARVTGNLRQFSKISIEDWNPIFAIQHKGVYILGDGHTRIYVLKEKGERKAPLNILETDSEIAFCREGALANFSTKERFLNNYYDSWRPNCLARNVKSACDLELDSHWDYRGCFLGGQKF